MIQPKNKQQAFNMLQDTINYYYNKPEKICARKGLCLYTPIKEIEHLTAGCAIGRYLPKELTLSLDEFESSVNSDEIFLNLPEWMQDMGKDFLGSLQDLHDRSADFQSFDHWESDINDICSFYGFKYSLLTFPKN